MKGTILIGDKTYTANYLINTLEGQKILRNARDEKQMTRETNIFCICNGKDKPIPMHAKKKPYSHSFTLGRDPNTMHLHNPNCIRYLDEANRKLEEKEKKKKTKQTKDIVNSEEWKEVRLFLNNYKVQDIKITRHKSDKKHDRISTTSFYSYLYTILQKVTTFAWYRYVMNPDNAFNPKEGNLFHIIYTELGNIKIFHSNIENEKKKNIEMDFNKLLFKPYLNIRNEDITNQLLKKRLHVTSSGIQAFKTLIIGKYLGHKLLENNLIKIKVYDPYLKNHYFVYSNKSSTKNKLKSNVPGAELYIIAYIIPENNLPMIEVMDSMSVLPGRGMYVESSYEIQFAEELLKKNILFIRPPSTEYIFYDLFKTHIPDFILIDKNNRRFATICEVFGYNRKDSRAASRKYWKKSNEKRKYYSTIRHKYNLLYWYAGDGDKMPDIYQPKSKNNT